MPKNTKELTWQELATQASGATDKAKAAMDKAIDAMKADGVTVDMFFSKKESSDEAKQFLVELKAAIVASWSKAKQDLVKLPPGSMTASQMERRKKQQQQISSRVKDFRKAFERRMPNTSGRKEKTTDKKYVVTRVDAMIARLRASDDPRVTDLEKFISLMEQAKKLMLN